MSREIDYSNPEEWTDDDRAYLAERPERVPEQYRHLIMPAQPPFAPMAEGQDPRMLRLVQYIQRNHPERAGEDPITVAIDLMGGESEADEPAEVDDYDQWKVAELENEARNVRKISDANLPAGADAKRKQPWVDALRQWDRENPA